ncbi:MAG TPA: hypothetical protein DCZ48_03945, partial [Methylococcaceae bacterium]|nr:hypothetical protein [Methylococcaceae bacterium]
RANGSLRLSTALFRFIPFALQILVASEEAVPRVSKFTDFHVRQNDCFMDFEKITGILITYEHQQFSR